MTSRWQDNEGNTALILGSKEGNTEVCMQLLDTGRCEVNKRSKVGHTALHYAAKAGQMGIVAALVFHGADVDCEDKWMNTPLMYATLHNQTNIVAFLVTAHCNVNASNQGRRAALHTASQNGHPNIVNLLLQGGATLDLPDKDGNCPGHLAGRYQHLSDLPHPSPGGL